MPASLTFEDLDFVKQLKGKDSSFLHIISTVHQEVQDLLDNRIPVIFPYYTLHNTKHSYRIIQYMYKLVADPSVLNELEVTLLICAALLHDIGMAVSSEDVDQIKSEKFAFSDIKFSAMKKLKNNDETVALQEYIRRIHGLLSARFIREKLKDKLIIPQFPNLDFTNELAMICQGHTEEYDWIKDKLKAYEVRGDYHFNAQFVASILRLADILDIDGQRTPYRLYQAIAPSGISNEEWMQNLTISNNDKILIDQGSEIKKIVFHGKCKKASIHRKLLMYIDWVTSELEHATENLNGMLPQYHLNFSIIPEVNIQAEGYTFSDYKMTLQFEAISSLLMGERIYGNRSLGLRELIQNCLDACRIRQEQEHAEWIFGQDVYEPKIKVVLDQANNRVTVKDNGIGMNIDVIKKHFLNIGVSYYKSDNFVLKDLEYQPIGNYGIGFLSCFMLSDSIIVKTRHFRNRETYIIELEKNIEWTSLTRSEEIGFFGTEVVLSYRKFMEVFNNNQEYVQEFLRKYFLTDRIELELITMPPKQSLLRIENLVSKSPEVGKGQYLVNFNTYLKSFDGYAILKRKHSFISTVDDLTVPGIFYFFNGEDLEEISEASPIKLDDFIVERELQYLYIPLVFDELEEEYLKGLTFLEDVEEVIRKLEKKLHWISILIPKNSHSIISPSAIEDGDFEIFTGLSFDHLVKLGHSQSCRTFYTVKEVNLFEGMGNRLYLPFTQTDKSFLSFYKKNESQRLFIRNVLIQNFDFDLPTVASIFEIESVKVNINSRNFIPDISRNNLDAPQRTLVNYIVGKAIHQAVKELFDLADEESVTLERFIQHYYQSTTEYEN